MKTRSVLFAVIVAGASVAACNPTPLTSDQLYGRRLADAAPPPPLPEPAPEPAPDTAPEPLPDAPAPADTQDVGPEMASPTPTPECPEEPPLGPRPVCEPHRFEAGVSGSVIDECDEHDALNTTLNANVSIGNQYRCSGAGKGAFDFALLQYGCPLTLVASKPGYHRYCRVLSPPRQGFIIKMKRIGGCTAPRPGASNCTCASQDPQCVPSSAL